MKIKKLILLILFIFLVISAPSLAGEVKFAQLSDVHITTKKGNKGGRMLEQSSMLLNDAILQINGVKNLDFTIFTGDLINEPNKNYFKEFKLAVNKLKKPWYWTTGNHDVGPGLNRKEFFAELNSINPHKQTKTYYTFTKDEFIFICMDGAVDLVPSPYGKFSKEELEWLNTQLTLNKDKYAVIFQHFPVVEPFKSADHFVLNADKYLEVIDRHKNVIAVVTGHYHGTKITKRNNVVHVSSPSLIQYPNAFRLITINSSDKGVKFNFEFKPTHLKQLRTSSFMQTKSSKLFEGKKEDKNTTIILPRS